MEKIVDNMQLAIYRMMLRVYYTSTLYIKNHHSSLNSLILVANQLITSLILSLS